MAISKYSNYSKGFTIVELLVVLAVTVLLSGGLVFYNRLSERQLILFQEQNKIIGVFNKAKSLTLGAFGEERAPCGYGVHFEMPDAFFIFEEESPGDDPRCFDIDFIYTANIDKEFGDSFKLDKATKFSELGLSDIIFIPPDPIIVIDNNLTKSEALIKIKTINGSAERTVKITTAGQITAQ